MKKITAIVLMVMLLFCANAGMITAYANSTQTHWRGEDSTGAVVVGGDCPIEVTREVLTFNITDFPSVNLYHELVGFDTRKSTVTAEYTFYNPTDMEITAKLAFPFVTRPSYANIAGNFDITLDGESVKKTTRHTYSAGDEFDLENDVAKLSDEYISHELFSPDTQVTKYTFSRASISGYTYNTYQAFDYDYGQLGANTKLFFPGASLVRLDNGKVRLGTRYNNKKTVEVYAIGEPLAEPIEWKFYSDYNMNDGEELNGSFQMSKSEKISFAQLMLTNWTADSGVNKVDWYNAVLCSLNHKADCGVVYFKYTSDLPRMSWYQYEIVIGPGESVVNTVTAPMYPYINAHKNSPMTCDYTYLLSPASTWAKFGELEININTPYYMNKSSIRGFTKTESGYTLTLNGLPDGEFEFRLSSSPTPTPDDYYTDPISIPRNYIYAGASLLVAAVGVALLIKRRRF